MHLRQHALYHRTTVRIFYERIDININKAVKQKWNELQKIVA